MNNIHNDNTHKMILSDTLSIKKIPEDWDFYTSILNRQPASYFINLALVELAPIIEYPDLFCMCLKMNQPREDRLSSQVEFQQLIDIEDALIPQCTQQLTAIYVGRLTHQQQRIFYFYLPTTKQDISIFLAQIMQEFPDYQYHFEIKEDVEWITYFDELYPDEKTLQCMENRKVVNQLEQHGDVLTQSRQVEHWIYFTTAENRAAFIAIVQTLGFDILSQETVTDHANYPYLLNISREDFIDLASVNNYTVELWVLAQQYHGDYDGWETQVM